MSDREVVAGYIEVLMRRREDMENAFQKLGRRFRRNLSLVTREVIDDLDGLIEDLIILEVQLFVEEKKILIKWR